MQTKEEIELLITALEKDLNELNEKREQIQKRITELNHQRQLLIHQHPSDSTSQAVQPSVTNHSSESEKIALFRSLFRGREDVFARRFESAKTGKSGYQPCCRNEWVQGICQKSQVKCNDFKNFFNKKPKRKLAQQCFRHFCVSFPLKFASNEVTKLKAIKKIKLCNFK